MAERPAKASCSEVKITFLVDNSEGPGCGAEHGLSMLIDADQKILFDAGQSSLFLKNAENLNLDLGNIDLAVLSHGHYDHGDGFEHFAGHRLICHPECFTRRYREKNGTYIGLKYDQLTAEKNFRLTLTAQPLKISESMTFLGAIPRLNDFEAKKTPFYLENGEPDFVPDDSAVAIKTSMGLIIIAGCSHAGICNIIDYACKVTGINDIVAVIGGFHLKEGSPVIEPTVAYLKGINAGLLMPCHCVDASVIEFLHANFKCESVFAGKSLLFPACF